MIIIRSKDFGSWIYFFNIGVIGLEFFRWEWDLAYLRTLWAYQKYATPREEKWRRDENSGMTKKLFKTKVN